jgi:hypothetical protein
MRTIDTFIGQSLFDLKRPTDPGYLHHIHITDTRIARDRSH